MLKKLNTLPPENYLLLDGSYGDKLLKKYPHLGSLPELANIYHPEDVLKLHQDYLAAGSQVLLTHTFGCNLTRLSRAQKLPLQDELLQRGIKLAKQAAAGKAYVAGCLGPQGFELKEAIQDKGSFEENCQHLLKAYAEENVDLIIFETQYHYEEILFNLNIAQNILKNKIPVWLSLTVTKEGAPLFVKDHPDWLKIFEDLGIHWLGFNCGFGPESILKAIQQTKSKTKIPLTAKPNLGLPSDIQNIGAQRSQEIFLKYAQETINSGITAIGACCQSGPDDILKLSQLRREDKA